ncbi:Cytochrome c oxidase assembly protein COX18, mitochondrial [Halotydeus destructor]|nr:Cytochrome c oxidase assembly protein COX18, mitochondrial [Halotydeus destructor]
MILKVVVRLAVLKSAQELGQGLETQVTRNKITKKEAQKNFAGHVRQEEKKMFRVMKSYPLRFVVLWMCDIGLWTTYMFSLRSIGIGFPHHLAAETYQQMSTESFGWIPCLTSPDPYMIIPVAAGLISLTNTEVM